MYLYQLKIITIYIVHHLLLININGKSAAQYYSVDDIAINCGSYGNPTALDGRQWVGDIGSKLVSSQDSKGKSISNSRPVQQSFYADPIPYMTARLSRSQFTYTFQVKPGQKFIRLHFYPASYTGFERSKALFTVKAGPYTLLSNFSASLTADDLGVKHFAKEFCLSIEEEDQLFNITFSPSKGTTSSSSSSSDDDVYAFINGIEIVSMPTGLYYTPEYDLGPRVVGNKFRFHIDKSTALEMVHRLNVGGRSILAIEDLGGMFRAWSEDKKFLLQYSGVTPVTTSTMIRYTGTPTYVAPPKVYQTAWSMGSNAQTNHQYNFTWKLPIDLGFRYLLRLHFCELEPIITVSGQKQFAISINNKIDETDADVIKWSGGNQQDAVYKDYVAMMEGDRMEGRRDLIIALQFLYQPSTENIDTILLKGIEIFKLSNPDNNLAGVNPAFTADAPVVGIPILRKLVLAFGTTDVIVTAATLVLVLLSSIVYQLNLSESNSDKINISSSSSSPSPSSHEEDLCRRFSFVEIQLATNDFDDARVIGKGGFGNVFKGFIDGGTKTVAIKRLNSGSGQGAREFWAEIDVLSKFRHNHLVSLIGYCDECQEMILVYEYMPHGTLADHLHKSKTNVNGNSPLPWEQRLNICIDSAQGLEFLHMGSGEQHGIIHRDVKSSNILLNENWVAKISDFGLSRMSRLSCTHISTNIKGTFGYMDPQYFKTQRLTKRSDVYAFGVVLLEVLSGRQAVDITLEEEQHSLALWAQQCIRKGTLDELVDPTVKEQISHHCLKEYAEIANKCLRKQPNQRPTMTEIMARLKLITLELQGRADSYRGQEVIDVGGTCNEHIDWSITSDESSQNEIKFKLVDSISPTTTKTRELLRKKKDYGSNNNGPSWGWRLWGSLWHRTKPLKTLQLHCRGFSLEEIRAATNNFNDRLLMKNENGGDGKVYEAYLEGIGKVAIKRYITSADFYNNFCTRLRVQSQIRCINIVSLVGYCYDNDWHEMILVNEYMANGSLFDHLHNTSNNNQRLSWKQRLQICIGAARGLNYLHTGSVKKTITIHGVLKSSNILLDQNWVAKISDLELSMLVREKITLVADTVAEEKSDVYSFGLVLFETLSGSKEFNMEVDHDDQRRALSEWVLECIEAGSLEQIIEPYLIRKISPLCLSVFVEIARKCLLLSATERPRMTDVLSTLELSLELQETANVAVEYEMIKMVEPRNSKKEENLFEEVSESLARAGLESCNLIVGIDFTKSNEWTGKYSFNGRSLHHMKGLNPYEQSILAIGKTLAAFDKDNLIPCFGFGDASTHDQDVFSLHPDERFCNGFNEVLSRYREIAPHLRLSGPTSFAPIIEMAMSIVEQSGCRYHVLLIIADGQVTTDISGQLSPQEQRTVEAIVEASKFPLSIILVGVGDGPWDMMRKFRDNIPDRAFNNFQFVNFTEIMSKNFPQSRKETEFALAALMEIPSQYKATIELNILGGRKGKAPRRVPLPPPPQCAATSAPNYSYDNQVCPICLSNPNDMAFGCGHQTCCDCGQDLQLCPICGVQIKPE